jgi:hypothetical protein
MRLEDVPEALRKADGIYLDDIMPVNWKPHPYTIGPRHVTYASEKCGGMLGEEVMEKVPCAAGECNLSLAEHTYDVVGFVKLTRDLTQDEARTFLKGIADAIPEIGKRLDGFCFIETGFKVLP